MTQNTPSEQLQKRQKQYSESKKKLITFLIVCTAVWILVAACSGTLVTLGLVNPGLGKGIILGSLLAAAIVMSLVSLHSMLKSEGYSTL